MRLFTLILSFLVCSISANATHIIGGVLEYDYAPLPTALNNYNITMTIFRDCNSQTPFDGQQGPFGNPARVAIFEQGTNIQVDTLNLWNPIVTLVQPPINSPCLNISTTVCVEQGVYNFSYNFPDLTKGYYVTYERCCRNGTINNLNAPGSQGATYSVDVPPTILYQNDNPEFNSFPPIFICVNAPLIFDHSATDANGDSLVYSLCDPLDGASQAMPAPTAGPKPYFSVNWQNPFNAQNALGGVPLSINSATGVLTGTPNMLGQYVVGVCVEEYRNGVLLSTTLRDFQFNVTTCNFPVAGIPGVSNIDPVSGIGDYFIDCTDFTVNFLNQSVGATAYFWNFGDPSTTGDTSNAFAPTYTFPDTGVYFVTLIASNSAQCRDTIVTRVKIFPVYDADFEYIPVCADSLVQFIDSSDGSYGFVNQWQWDFGDGVGSSNQQNPAYQYSTGGLYNVNLISESSKGCIDTVSKQITVYPLPNANFANVSGCINDALNFIQTTNGSITYSAWDFGDASPISNQTNPSHVYSQAGSYNVSLSVITNKGCKDTITKSVQIFNLPMVSSSSDTIICPESTTSLSATGAVNYNWTPPALFNNPLSPNPIVTINSAQYVYVVGTDQNGCSSGDSTFIDLYPNPQIDAGEDTSVCLEPNSFRDSVTLYASGGVSYSWNPVAGLDDPNIFNPTARPPVNMTYYVTAIDTNGCVGSDSVRVYYLNPQLDLIADTLAQICVFDSISIPVLDLGLITIYSWNPMTGLSDPNIRDPLFHPLTTTEFILTISNYCYFKDDSVTVIVNPLPVVNTGTLDSICIGDTIQLNANGGVTYQWDPDATLSNTNIPNPLAYPTVDNTYYVNVTDAIGCENDDSITILVYLPPITGTGINDDRTFICFGQSIYLNATGGVSYFWEEDPTLYNLDTVSPLATPTDTQTYYVTVTNVHGCSADDSLVVDVQGALNPSVDTTYVVCEGGVQRLNVSGGFYYQWIPSTYLNYDNIKNPVVNPLSDIQYIVEVANDCFQDSVFIAIQMQPLPVAEAGLDQSINRGNVTFMEGGGGGDYLWLPIEGLVDPTSAGSQASPLETTQYVLRVTDEFGCVDYDTMLLSVLPVDQVLIPSGFTPNNDGSNDRFGILESSNIDYIIQFAVYNRWGEKVFATNDRRVLWDGTYRGQSAEIGTYSFLLEYVNLDGENITKSGTLTLLR